MTGTRYRAMTLEGEHRYYNVKIPVRDLDLLKKLAEKKRVTTAELIRIAVARFLLDTDSE